MAPPPPERRGQRSQRYKITLFVGGDPEEFVPIGRTTDLSSSGIFLETDKRPGIGSDEQISFVWGDETYFCKARVVRHADNGIGLEFQDPDAGFQWALAEIIQEMSED